MEYMLTPWTKGIEPFLWWENAFTNSELDWLQQKAKEAQAKAFTGDSFEKENKELRRTKLNWLNCCSENNWIFEKLANVVQELNAKFYNFQLTGFGEAIQLTNYLSEDKGTYGWHQDFGSMGPSRKLSVVMQLTDPSEYMGGCLELKTRKETTKIQAQRGLITIFPAWTLHQVTPVTQGSRQSLVAWVSGEPFK